jgi:hypothetical protein
MTGEEALQELRAILRKGLYPAAVPNVKEILTQLEKDSHQAGYEEAVETVGDWYEPEHQSNEGYD